MDMRWCLSGLILSFCSILQTADSRPLSSSTTPLPVSLTEYPAPAALLHPLPTKLSIPDQTTVIGGSEPTSPEKSGKTIGGGTAPTSPFKRLGLSPKTSPKRSREQEEENLPGSASPQRPRAESAPVTAPYRIAALKKLLFDNPEEQGITDPSPACTSGHASAFPEDGESLSLPISGRSSSMFGRLTRLAHRRVSDPFLFQDPGYASPDKAAITPLPTTPGSPASYAWPTPYHTTPKTPASRLVLKSMDIHNPRTTSIEHALLINEAQELELAIQGSPAAQPITEDLRARWTQVVTRKEQFEQQFEHAAHNLFNPRIQNMYRLSDLHKKNPTYTGATEIYNLAYALEEELSQWKGTNLYEKLKTTCQQAADCLRIAQNIEQAAGTKHKQALAALLEKNLQPGDFDTLLPDYQNALTTFQHDITTAYKNAKIASVQDAFAKLQEETTQWLKNHSTAEQLALLKKDNPGPTWGDYMHTLTKGPRAFVGGRLRTDMCTQDGGYRNPVRTRLRSSSTDSTEEHARRRTRYNSGCSETQPDFDEADADSDHDAMSDVA